MSNSGCGDVSAALFRKAEEDATAVRELVDNDNVADAIVGFHAQQAVEKWLKAVLAARGVGFERTHDLDRLIELVESDGLVLPVAIDQLSVLSEYAVPFRYDDPIEAEPLNRREVLADVQAVGAWARERLTDR